jgi:hypothetical protein
MGKWWISIGGLQHDSSEGGVEPQAGTRNRRGTRERTNKETVTPDIRG